MFHLLSIRKYWNLCVNGKQPESRVRAGLPHGEVTERCEDQDDGKGLRRYGPCSLLPVCASPWAKCGRVDTTFCPVLFIYPQVSRIIYRFDNNPVRSWQSR